MWDVNCINHSYIPLKILRKIIFLIIKNCQKKKLMEISWHKISYFPHENYALMAPNFYTKLLKLIFIRIMTFNLFWNFQYVTSNVEFFKILDFTPLFWDSFEVVEINNYKKSKSTNSKNIHPCFSILIFEFSKSWVVHLFF